MTIYPTHRCFDDVLDHQVELARREPAIAARQFIVHGIVRYPDDAGADAGRWFAHAWVEDDDEQRVYQSGLLDGRMVWFSADRAEWYGAMRVLARTRYTLDRARILNWQTTHYGPWVSAYRALCRDARPAAREQ